MLRIVLAAMPATLVATSAMAGIEAPASPAPGILGLVAAGVIAGVFLARRRQ